VPKCLVVCCDGTWNTPDQKDRGQVRPSNVAKTALALARRSRDGREQALAVDEKRGPFRPAVWERQAHSAHQTLNQAWFAGAHSNVGGGYADTGLSDLAFTWMKEQAGACGLAFDARVIEQLGVWPCWNGVLRDSKTGLYRFSRDYQREIGRALNGNESVHPSVRRRVEARPDYRPVNLPSRARR
jgi:uncharacterized protein (DUF2235 family)